MTIPQKSPGPNVRSLAAIGLMVAGVGLLLPHSTVAADGPQSTMVMAGTCSATDVQAALDAAVTAGGTVVLPAGSCDWGSQSVTLHMSNHGVYLRGAGKGAGGTAIKRSSAGYDTSALTFNCAGASGGVEMSDIAFVGNAQTGGLDAGVSLVNSCQDFKIHDASFTKFVKSGVETVGTNSRGVIYKNDFTNNYDPGAPSDGYGYGVVVYGTDSDPRPTLSLGGPQAVFIEDNYFRQNRHSVASNQNSRYVVRYNEFITTDTTRNTAMVDAHGKASNINHGSRSWEVYENTLYFEGVDYQADGISMRGGDGVVFNNILGGSKTSGLTVAYVLQLVTENGCPLGGQPFVDDQTEKAWVWGNTWMQTVAEQGVTVRTPFSASQDCRLYFREGQEYFLNAPANYVPYVYPHPLRGDTIFKNGFE
ncbi:MAG: hypothetical protein ABIO49_06485 [Dokdonella sp.]